MHLSRRLIRTAALLLIIPFCAASPRHADAQEDVLRSEMDQLAADSERVKALIDQLVVPGHGKDTEIRKQLHGLAVHVTRPGAEEQRKRFADTLCEAIAGDRPVVNKRFLIRQLQIAGVRESVPALAECLTDHLLAEDARRALVAIPDRSAIAALREALPETEGDLRIGILNALGRRPDPASFDVLMQYARSDDEAIRVAALESLAEYGNPTAGDVFVSALGRGSKTTQRRVVDAYIRLADNIRTGRRADVATRRGKLMQRVLDMYARAIRAADDPALKCAALVGASKIGPSATDLILRNIGDEDATVRHTVRECLERMPDERVSAAIERALEEAKPPARAALLRILGERSDAKAARIIEQAADDPNPEVRVTAWDLLGRLEKPTSEMKPVLLDAAENGSQNVRPVALGAYVDLAAAELAGSDEAEALLMYGRALALTPGDKIRRRILADLEENGSEACLELVEPLTRDPAVRSNALRVFVGVANRLADAGNRTRAIELLRQTIDSQPPAHVRDLAARALWQLDVDFDPAHDRGYITKWWLCGPVLGQDIHKAYAPERNVDLDATVQLGNVERSWRFHRTTDPQGVVNLVELMDPHEHATCYLYAEVNVANAQDVVLKIGSNDGMKLWLNGALIHTFPGQRSLTVDEDTVKAGLEKGRNTFLMKVTQGGGGWAACVRMLGQDGQPISFTQAEQDQK